MDDAPRTECEASWREEAQSADGAEARGYNEDLSHILLKNAPATMKW